MSIKMLAANIRNTCLTKGFKIRIVSRLMKIRKKGRFFTLPTKSVLSRVIRRVMRRAVYKDVSEEDIFRKLSKNTGLSVNYFKGRRKDILAISDGIARELGLERDTIARHFNEIEAILHRCLFVWPDDPENILPRKELSQYVAGYLVKYFDDFEINETGETDSGFISLDDIYEALAADERLGALDPEFLAYALSEVWDYLLAQSLIS